MVFIDFNKVADLYDSYVKVDFDIPFFLKETEGYEDEILELMCGTGRVSIPLLENGRKLTCIDYSKKMLDVFSNKIDNKNYSVNLVEMDVINLNLDKKFGLILLPFHSLAEIANIDLQKQALSRIGECLCKGGKILLTLQNPALRVKSADGSIRNVGKFPIDSGKSMSLSYVNHYNSNDKIVTGFQFYEIYSSDDTLIERRCLEVKFRLTTDAEIQSMITETGLEIINRFGDYSYAPFNDNSTYMIYQIQKY